MLVLVAVAAFVPAHATATLVNGYANGYYGGFGDPDDYLLLDIGTGGPLYVPGAADAGDLGSGVVAIVVQALDYSTKIDVRVVLTTASVTTEGGYRVFDGRGLGSDGNCWGLSVAVDEYQNIYVGIVNNAASTVTDPNGACVAESRQFLAYGEFIFTDV